MVFVVVKIDDQCLESILGIFSIIPGLELAKKTQQPPKEEEASETTTTAKTASDSWELFALKRELLTSDSNITQIAIHRKLFNDCFVNFLRNKVINDRYERT